MQSTHVAIMPMLLLIVIGLSLLFAVTIVIVSLAKAGKVAGVIVVMVALALGGLLLAGLLVPMFHARQAAMSRAHAQYDELIIEGPYVAPPPVQPPRSRQLMPNFVNVAPSPMVEAPAAPPMPQAWSGEPASPTPEVTSETEIETVEEKHEKVNAAQDESSASSHEAEQSEEEWGSESKAAAEPAPDSPRPAWVDEVAIPTRDIVYKKAITIGRYNTLEEIQALLPQQVDEALRNFMREALPRGAAEVVKLPPGYAVDHGVLADRWLETHPAAEHSFSEPMYSLHVLTQVDKATRDDLHARFEAAVVDHRVGMMGLGGGLLLALLGTLYGYLKLDTLTQGYYTGRLRLAAGLTGLSAAAGAAALVAERVVMWV